MPQKPLINPALLRPGNTGLPNMPMVPSHTPTSLLNKPNPALQSALMQQGNSTLVNPSMNAQVDNSLDSLPLGSGQSLSMDSMAGPSAASAGIGSLMSGADSSDGGFLGGLTKNWNANDTIGAAGVGLSALGGLLNANQQNKQFQQNLGLEQGQLANQTLQTAGNISQLDPYAQQEDYARNMLKAAMAEGGPAQATLGNGSALDPGKALRAAALNNALNPTTLNAAKSTFDSNMAKAQQQAAQQSSQNSGPSTASQIGGTAGSIAGMLAGQALIPIPGVGAAIGGTLGKLLGGIF